MIIAILGIATKKHTKSGNEKLSVAGGIWCCFTCASSKDRQDSRANSRKETRDWRKTRHNTGYQQLLEMCNL